jgi:hypothetical protein
MNNTRRKMNSFKKIALGLVAAMTLGTIVATPASANTLTLAVSTNVGGSGTAAAPYTIKVPFDNAVSDTTTVGSQEALTLSLSNLTLNVPVTVSGAGNVKLLTALGGASTSGVTSLTFTPLATTATVYAYTTSTSASAVTVSVLGTSQTVYLKGLAGDPFFLTGTVPASGHIGGKVVATLNVADIFGNPVAATITGTAINATVGASTADALVVGKYTVDITLPATAGTAAVNFTIPNPTDVPTLATEVISVTAIVTATDLGAALAAMTAAKDAADKALADEKAASAKALADAKVASDAALAKAKADADAAALKAAADLVVANAEVAKLKAEAVTAKAAADKALADATAAHVAELAKVKADNDVALAAIKKAFNSLAKKWNKKNPSAKVVLVK